MTKKPDDTYHRPDEVARRRDEVVRRMANTPPRPITAQQKKTKAAVDPAARKGRDNREP